MSMGSSPLLSNGYHEGMPSGSKTKREVSGRPHGVQHPCLDQKQRLDRERQPSQQAGSHVARPTHTAEGPPTWMAEEHHLKCAQHKDASPTVAGPSCEVRRPQRRPSHITRCVRTALSVKRTCRLLESARQTTSRSLLHKRSPAMQPIISLPAEVFFHRRHASSAFEGRSWSTGWRALSRLFRMVVSPESALLGMKIGCFSDSSDTLSPATLGATL